MKSFVAGVMCCLLCVVAVSMAGGTGDGSSVRVVIVENGTRTVYECQPMITSMPTPSPTMTETPRPTSTPTPAATATATIMPALSSTPTQEITTLPPVTPSDKPCELKASLSSIRVRTGPGLNYEWVGGWGRGENRTFTRFVKADNFLWGQHGVGRWSAVAQWVHVTGWSWWVSGYEGVGVCQDAEGWPEGLVLPESVAMLNEGKSKNETTMGYPS
jgi:hypothetical protein